MTGKTQKAIKTFLYMAAALLAIWCSLRFLLPWTAPILLAAFFAAVMEKAVRQLCRRGWPRPVASGFCTLLSLSVLAVLAALLITRGAAAISGLAVNLPTLLVGFSDALQNWKGKVLDFAAQAPSGTEAYAIGALDAIAKAFSDIPLRVSGWLLSFLSSLTAKTPDILLFIATTGIGIYFISASYPEIRNFIKAQIPANWEQRSAVVKNDLWRSCIKYLKAQLILSAITMGELAAALTLLGVRKPFGTAAVIAIIDALPILGAGIVLVPWAIYELLIGDVPMGMGLAVTFAAVTVVHNCIQPKLIGDQLGLPPIVTLLAIYVGWRVAGVAGMLLFPLAAITIIQLNDRGIISLWKPARTK